MAPSTTQKGELCWELACPTHTHRHCDCVIVREKVQPVHKRLPTTLDVSTSLSVRLSVCPSFCLSITHTQCVCVSLCVCVCRVCVCVCLCVYVYVCLFMCVCVSVCCVLHFSCVVLYYSVLCCVVLRQLCCVFFLCVCVRACVCVCVCVCVGQAGMIRNETKRKGPLGVPSAWSLVAWHGHVPPMAMCTHRFPSSCREAAFRAVQAQALTFDISHCVCRYATDTGFRGTTSMVTNSSSSTIQTIPENPLVLVCASNPFQAYLVLVPKRCCHVLVEVLKCMLVVIAAECV